MLAGGFRGEEKEKHFVKFKIVDLITNTLINAQDALSQRHESSVSKRTGRLAAGDIFWYNQLAYDKRNHTLYVLGK